MARRPRTQATPAAAQIEDLRHPVDVTRRNIPTAETQALMAEEEAAPKPMLYPRNPDLDPQLVWRGKDELDAAPLRVPTVPIYIQEKVLPAALIRDLKRVSKGCEPQADLFGGFDRIEDPEMRMEFYQHAENWSNRMILGDSLLVMNSLAEKEGLRGQVQCIYFDPPFGISFASNWQPSTRSRSVSDSVKDVSTEPEVISAFRDTWRDGIHTYLAYLRDRLVVARELLTDSGSIFVQIGDQNVHRVRSLLDEVFGPDNAVVTILLKKKGSQRSTLIDPVNDYILWYSRRPRDDGVVKFHPMFEARELDADTLDEFSRIELPDGAEFRLADLSGPDGSTIDYRIRPQQILRDYPAAKLFSANPIMNGGFRANQMDPVFVRGKWLSPSPGQCWRHQSKASGDGLTGMDRIVASGRLIGTETGPRFKRFLSDFPYKTISNWWDGFGGPPNPVYAVQTNEDVVKRCVLMTTDPGDLVLDPTCGSGTSAFVSEQWGRRWITIDTSRVSLALARTRLTAARHPAYLLRDSQEGADAEAKEMGRPRIEMAFTRDIRQGFVLERTARITSSTIANNAEIDIIHTKWQSSLDKARTALNAALRTRHEEWQMPLVLPGTATQQARATHEVFWQQYRQREKEIDGSIARQADTEYLHDRPYIKRSTVRVTGPFTVESLSPHRVLPTGENDAALLAAIEEETGEPTPPRHQLRIPEPETDFATVVLENLRAGGVQNTRKNERLMFSTLKPWPGGATISAEGEYEENGQRKRAAIVIGPEYGTVAADLVREAAREARDLFDTLVICGFAFDPHVGEGTMNLGRLTVLKARMNQELHAATAYKAGGGNLFVVFGEPDIAVHANPNGTYCVEIRGVDIFDPTSGEVRSSGDVKQDIACWFIDTDYDGDSFFVRHAYFLGSRDPFEQLKSALRAEIDQDAWSALYSTKSRPFPRPKSGRVAVKVINHHGDEAMRVYPLIKHDTS